jgi:hypothetical protein
VKRRCFCFVFVMSVTSHDWKSPLNAAKALRVRVEAEAARLQNEAALLRDREAAASARTTQLAARAAAASDRHRSRALNALFWAAAKESGVHPLKAVGGVFAVTPVSLDAAAELMPSLGRAEAWAGAAGSPAVAALVGSRAAQAETAGAALATSAPGAPPPRHPRALAAWVVAQREQLREAVVGRVGAAEGARREVGVEERENAGERRAARAAARAARLARYREMVEATRAAEAAAAAAREARAAEVAAAARLEYDARVAAELSAASVASATLAPLESLRDRAAEGARGAAGESVAAWAALDNARAAPPLPLPARLSAADLALASAAAGAVVGAEALNGSLSSRAHGWGAAVAGGTPLGALIGARPVAPRSSATAVEATALRVSQERTTAALVQANAALAGTLPAALGAVPGGGAIASARSLSSSMWSAGSGWGGGESYVGFGPPPPVGGGGSGGVSPAATARALLAGGSPLPSPGGAAPPLGAAPSAASLRLLPPGLWPLAPPTPRRPFSPVGAPASPLALLRGGALPPLRATDAGVVEARVAVELPSPGRRAPLASTLRPSPLPHNALQLSLAALQGGR